ncbi:MAG TPA: FISUMP domain-containing protein [Prolixibacteraceae bacterium]|nr:FISUMP domain-containing protein [Prolixibacteraceae bacterium]
MKYIIFCSLLVVGLILTQCDKDFIPNFEISSPAEGATIYIGDTVTITIDVDHYKSIERIDLYIDTFRVEILCCEQYYYKWVTGDCSACFGYYAEPGEHTITAHAFDKDGTVFSDEITINVESKPLIPYVRTKSATVISTKSAIFYGFFQNYSKPVNQFGFFWSKSDSDPGEKNDVILVNAKGIDFKVNADNLEANTTYYYKAFAEIDDSILTGSVASFKTKEKIDVEITDGNFTDSRDNKNYRVVEIGKQTWMAENLAYLPVINHPEEATITSRPVYLVYDYFGICTDSAKASDNYQSYGVLYNWHAAIDACPAGWHLPTHNDWDELRTFISEKEGMDKLRTGNFIKAETGWGQDGNGNDKYGFSAVPGGAYLNEFMGKGVFAFWWASDLMSPEYPAFHRWFMFNDTNFSCQNEDQYQCLSARCIKD